LPQPNDYQYALANDLTTDDDAQNAIAAFLGFNATDL